MMKIVGTLDPNKGKKILFEYVFNSSIDSNIESKLLNNTFFNIIKMFLLKMSSLFTFVKKRDAVTYFFLT